MKPVALRVMVRARDIRFGSKADMCSATAHVC
jgi:hypothetical protein